MSMSQMSDHFDTVLNTCNNHQTGNGRECSWYADSEYYSQETLKPQVTVKGD